MKARSALFTLFGDVVGPSGGEAWLSTITACMDTLGFSSQAVRTALHRMSSEGWVEPRKEGRYSAYRLTNQGVDRLEQAAVRIYGLQSREWDGGWRLLLSPDLADPDIIAELEWTGYGNLQPGVWANPHPHPDQVRALLATAGVAATWLDHAVVDDDAELAAAAWELEELRAKHIEFLGQWRRLEVPQDRGAAFAIRLRLVHHWRSFLFLDPGLPTQALPSDWPGFEAARTFARAYEAVRERSWAFYRQVQGAAPGGSINPEAVLVADPFARGLAAMQQTRAAGRGVSRVVGTYPTG